MPELPEVETIVNGLAISVKNKNISKINTYTASIFKPNTETLQNALQNSQITDIIRHGKYIFIRLKNTSENWLMVHLRMTGQLMLTEINSPIDKHTHIEIYFKDYDKKLIYRDIRKFGRLQILDSTPNAYIVEHKLAPDALDITLKKFSERITKRKGIIKALLLDQSVIAGIGNIYADEILIRSKIHPGQNISNLSPKQIAVIHEKMLEVLKQAVFRGGTSFSDYVNSFGKKGSFQLELSAYQQTGKPCKVCGNIIVKIKIAGRSTHFCPQCQQL